MKYTDEFPLMGTKVDGLDKKFDLSTPEVRKEYFEAKVGTEIKKLKEFFKDKTFIAYLLAKKSAGKGTYTKLMKEIFGDVIGHVSVGDVVRAAHKTFEEGGEEKDKLYSFLQERYRGYISLDDAIDALLGRSQDKLLPTEMIITLVEAEIDKLERKTLFIDGLPRDLDQISYTLFFRSLIDYRKDPDLFVMIDIPESIIEERMKYRVICPVCQAPRNTKVLRTKNIGYDKENKEFYLLCDEHGERMVPKDGDAEGLESIRGRLDKDQSLIDKTTTIYGVPKILLRNAIPVSEAKKYFDDYEITPMYSYEFDDKGEVVVKESPWTVKDDEGVEVNSLLSPSAVVVLIKQLTSALKL
jgi:adenylate kinase family enzyme